MCEDDLTKEALLRLIGDDVGNSDDFDEVVVDLVGDLVPNPASNRTRARLARRRAQRKREKRHKQKVENLAEKWRLQRWFSQAKNPARPPIYEIFCIDGRTFTRLNLNADHQEETFSAAPGLSQSRLRGSVLASKRSDLPDHLPPATTALVRLKHYTCVGCKIIQITESEHRFYYKHLAVDAFHLVCSGPSGPSVVTVRWLRKRQR